MSWFKLTIFRFNGRCVGKARPCCQGIFLSLLWLTNLLSWLMDKRISQDRPTKLFFLFLSLQLRFIFNNLFFLFWVSILDPGDGWRRTTFGVTSTSSSSSSADASASTQWVPTTFEQSLETRRAANVGVGLKLQLLVRVGRKSEIVRKCVRVEFLTKTSDIKFDFRIFVFCRHPLKHQCHLFLDLVYSNETYC